MQFEEKDLDEILNPEDFDEEDEEETDGKDDSGDSEEKEPGLEGKSDGDANPDDDGEEEKKRINAKNAERRRKRQAREKERLENEQRVREKAVLEGQLSVLKENPYTHEKIEDEEDIRIYRLQKEIDDEGGDPLADLPRKLAQKNREAAKEKAEKEKAANAEQERMNKEIADFRKERPGVDTVKLADDREFMEFGKGKFGRWTFAEVYDAYQDKLTKEAGKKTAENDERKVREASVRQTRLPSSSGSGKATAESVTSMTDEEFMKYWNKNYS